MKKILLTILLIFVFCSRLVGINWGLPYPMHPDERNIAAAVEQLNCNTQDLKNCLNPHFFAYGQAPIYLSFALVNLSRIVRLQPATAPISFDEAIITLRLISVISSLATIYILFRIITVFFRDKKKLPAFEKIIIITLLSFAPYAIQLSHFGTTESILIFLYSAITYFCLKLSNKFDIKSLLKIGFLIGFATGIKISSAIFASTLCFVVLFQLIRALKNKSKKQFLVLIAKSFVSISTFSLFGYVISSPYNLIAFSDFVSSINYESAVALGNLQVFYTRQFYLSLPYYFQFVKVFPFVLGIPMLVVFLVSYFALPHKDIKYFLIRMSFLLPFLFFGATYAKWSRFVSAVFPIMSLFIVLVVLRVWDKMKQISLARILLFIGVILLIVPGVAYISIYSSPDVRFKASEWIYKNIDDNKTILSETANVIDIPVKTQAIDNGVQTKKNFSVMSFDFYNLDTDINLQNQLAGFVNNVDYIFVPSRRIFANHTCYAPKDSLAIINWNKIAYNPRRCLELANKYNHLNNYYKNLFDPNKYKQIAEITSYPRISILGKTIIEFKDEDAEETFTVFDHPVVRIYKKI